MSSSMSTILIIGGTSGIGEAFAHRFHSQGKKLIITGRRQERLQQLEKDLPGAATHVWDNADLASIPEHVSTLFDQHDIDTVWVNSGMQYPSNIKDVESTTDEKVRQEITVNLTAPLLIARHVIPRLLARQGKEATFMITSSGLAYVPMGVFPVYCPTKAAIHAYLVGIRQTLQGSNVNVLEIVPPAVYTDLADFSKVPGTMELQDFVDEIFGKLDGAGKAGELKEVAAGSAVGRVEAWRGSIGKIMEERKLGG